MLAQRFWRKNAQLINQLRPCTFLRNRHFLTEFLFWTFFPRNQIWRWIYKLANMLFSVKSYQIIFFLHCPIFTLNEIWRKIMGVVCVFTTFSEKFLENSSKFLKESTRIPFTLNDHFTPDGGLKFSFVKTNQFHVKVTKRKNVEITEFYCHNVFPKISSN